MKHPRKLPLRTTGKRKPAQLPAVIKVRNVRRWIYSGVAMLGAAACTALAIAFNIPQHVSLATQAATASLGFDVAQVEVTGLKYLKRVDVHVAVAKAGGGSMLFTDVDVIRAGVEALPWVKSATVSRQLPDHMSIDITERTPVALWQLNHRLSIIDISGRVLETRQFKPFAHLPLVVGEGANVRVANLLADMTQVPQLKGKVDTLVWTGNRRWDVQFKSGDTLQLPEGRAESQAALVAFAQLDAANGLLGKGLGQFDMRVADRLFIRSPSSGTNMTQSPASKDRAI
jgi:cell division protein FtsQ